VIFVTFLVEVGRRGAIVSICGLANVGYDGFVALEEEVGVFFDLNGRVREYEIAPNLRQRAESSMSMC